jgi:hypothetical protein
MSDLAGIKNGHIVESIVLEFDWLQRSFIQEKAGITNRFADEIHVCHRVCKNETQ